MSLAMKRKFNILCSERHRVGCLIVGAFLLCCFLFAPSSCSDNDGGTQQADNGFIEVPALELKTTRDMGSISTSQEVLLAGGQDSYLYLWKWAGLNVQPRRIRVELWYPQREYSGPLFPQNKGYALLYPSNLLYAAHTEDDTYLVLRDLRDDQELNRWSIGRQWYCERLRNSRNGKYVAVHLRELDRFVLEDDNRRDDGRHRFGVLSSQFPEAKWAPDLFIYDLPIISEVAVSEDGNYVAAVGTKNGGFIHVADVVRQKVLWEKVPHGDDLPHGIWTVNFNDVAFSPDSNSIYVAGNVGLFTFEVATGKILSQWQIDGRFISVAASPDGRLVAGGTELSGFVYIYCAQTGKILLKLRTGQHSIYGLAFSPDSAFLATSGVLRTNIKIWKMPSIDTQQKESSE